MILNRENQPCLLVSTLYGSDYMPFLIQTEEPLFPFSHSSISFFFNNFSLVSFAIDNSRTWAFRFKWFLFKSQRARCQLHPVLILKVSILHSLRFKVYPYCLKLHTSRVVYCC